MVELIEATTIGDLLRGAAEDSVGEAVVLPDARATYPKLFPTLEEQDETDLQLPEAPALRQIVDMGAGARDGSSAARPLTPVSTGFRVARWRLLHSTTLGSARI